MMDSTDPWLLHFTHIDNLRKIAAAGLLSDSKAPMDVRECGQQSIKQRRRGRTVPLQPGGVVADYVPFYFGPRSPMLFSILGGQVEEFDSDQTHLIYLVTRLSRIVEHDQPWVATDRNAALSTAKFTSDKERLSTHIDWEIMDAPYWANTAEDGSRRERRMAELLVHDSVPWAAFSHVNVCCAARASEVEACLGTFSHRPRVLVRPDWYFYVPSNCSCQTRS